MKYVLRTRIMVINQPFGADICGKNEFIWYIESESNYFFMGKTFYSFVSSKEMNCKLKTYRENFPVDFDHLGLQMNWKNHPNAIFFLICH